MNRQLQKTKHKLTLISVSVVFLLITILGATFFAVKYIQLSRIDKNNVLLISQSIANEKREISDLKRSLGQGNRLNNGPKSPQGGPARNNRLSKLNVAGIPVGVNLSYIHLDANNRIIDVNIRGNIDDELLFDVLSEERFSYGVKRDDFFIKKTLLRTNEQIIFFLKSRYSVDDLLSDILGFLIINILFSAVLFVLGKKFIHKTFVPIEENIHDMKNFVHNAGHELKTPIAVIDSNLQLFRETKTYDDTMVGEMRAEVSKLNSLIESLVKLSDIDSFKEKNSLSIKELVEEVLSDFGSQMTEKNITVNTDISDKKMIHTHKDYLYIFIANIIGNAIKYNKTGGSIMIKMSGNKLHISDTGIGISGKNIGKIFNRFFKGDESRNSEGFGIGLSLVKKIADMYKWNITVTSTKGEGTTCIIAF